MENISNKLCLLTPSYIDSEERLNFASDSYDSLTKSLNFDELQHFIVDDSDPIYLDNLRSSPHCKKLYDLYRLGSPKIIYRNKPQGSASAMLDAVNSALDKGHIFGFIHLDDQTYNNEFHTLVSSAINAMEVDDEISWLRFSGYPLIHNGNKKFFFDNDNDSVIIDGIDFKPSRYKSYTSWLTSLDKTKEVNPVNYWPVALWHSIFRLEVLKTILERGLSIYGGLETLKRRVLGKSIHLCHVELTYKSNFGFNSLIQNYPNAKYGYINMQFGGFEIHRNSNWKQLMESYDNRPIR